MLTIQMLNEKLMNIFEILQDFITVQQFQLLNWPIGQAIPDSPAPLIAIYGLIEKWRQEQPQNLYGIKRTTFHCM